MKSFILITVFLFIGNLFSWGQYTIYNSWDFENEELGQYTDTEIIEDFNYTILYSHNASSIVMDTINGLATKVFKVTHPANKLADGFEMNVDLGQDYKELYLSYNVKFSEEFNSTAGGKLPGLGGLPDFGTHCPSGEKGFRAHNMFKQAGSIISYHYDRTTGTCPWAIDNYKYNKIFFDNGTWYNITQRLVLNTFTDGVANKDGIKELWVDGRLIYQKSDMKYMEVESDDLGIDAFRLSNFYGGSGESYTPLTESYTYFDNFTVYIPTDDSISDYELHHTETILPTPVEIIDRRVYYDSLISTEGILSNSEYGNEYSYSIDEAYLIDAGEGNTVTYTLTNYSLAHGDCLFLYDGNTTDASMIKMYEGGTGTNKEFKSTGRYMFIRFSTERVTNGPGWTGNIAFEKTTTDIFEKKNLNELGSQIKLIPNPCKNQITIQGLVKESELSMFDITGRRVLYKERMTNNELLDIQNLPKGIYTINITGNKYRLRFIKN